MCFVCRNSNLMCQRKRRQRRTRRRKGWEQMKSRHQVKRTMRNLLLFLSRHAKRLILRPLWQRRQLHLQPQHFHLSKVFVSKLSDTLYHCQDNHWEQSFMCSLQLQPCQRYLRYQISSFPVLPELWSKHPRLLWIWIWHVAGWGEERAEGTNNLKESWFWNDLLF